MAAYTTAQVRTAVNSLTDSAQTAVGAYLQPALDYIRVIGENNPPAKVAKRSDVRAALDHAASGAEAKALPLVHEAWAEGLRAADFTGEVDDSLLVDLVGDVERIMSSASQDILDSYVDGGQEAAIKAQRRAAYRTALAVEAAFTHARGLAQVAQNKDSGTLKQWRTTSAVPCSHCVHLSLLPPLPWDEEFPSDVPGLPILSVYARKFLGPPRHPNCRCYLLAVPKS